MSPYKGRRGTYETKRRIFEFCRALGCSDSVRIAASHYLDLIIDSFGRVDYNAFGLALILFSLREHGDKRRMDEIYDQVNSNESLHHFSRTRVVFRKDLRRWYVRVSNRLGEQNVGSSGRLDYELVKALNKMNVDSEVKGMVESTAKRYLAGHVVANIPALVCSALANAMKQRGYNYSLKDIASTMGVNYRSAVHYNHLLRV